MKVPSAQQWIVKFSTWRKEREIDSFELGKEMREYREDCGKTLRQTAIAIGISAPYLSDCERGFRKLDEKRLQRFIDFCSK